MKQSILLFLTLFLSSFSFLSAQDCTEGYFPFVEGIEMEQTFYNGKGKVQTVQNMKVISVTEANGTYKAKINSKIDEGKKKSEAFEVESYITCKEGGWEMDFESILSSAMSMNEMPENVEVKVESTPIFFPIDMKPGDKLDDATITMSASMMGLAMINTKVTQTNRKVVGKETITVPAGTFDCLKITYTLTSSYGMGERTEESTIWLAKNVGLVKEETYNKGKLDSYTELTLLKN